MLQNPLFHDLLIAVAPTAAGLLINLAVGWAGKSSTPWGRFLAAWLATAPALLKKSFSAEEEAPK